MDRLLQRLIIATAPLARVSVKGTAAVVRILLRRGSSETIGATLTSLADNHHRLAHELLNEPGNLVEKIEQKDLSGLLGSHHTAIRTAAMTLSGKIGVTSTQP